MRIRTSLTICSLLAALSESLADKVDFAREILPILSDKCFVCHGPDTKKKSMLRLDSTETATVDRGGYRAIDPTTPQKSELIQRIFDFNDPMPPKDAEKQLNGAEKAKLKQWVLEGGAYTKHWAFVPPTRKKADNIDGLIESQLKSAGIPFAEEADRRILARRVALILTGLPPEPEQLKTFLADKSSKAYARFVDRMMSSPRFGEHQARYWLDAVRYGDTHGLHLDNRRGIYPYRDWVVRAFNENLPLDKFIEWQLAGDLHPDPSLEQLVATGFVRMNPTTGEGGAIPEEFQAKNNFDRVETLGTALLGLSLTCARCHTHKYDPIQQKEYYQLMAYFNSTAEPSMDGNAYRYGPTAKVPEHPAAWDEWEELKQSRSELLNQVKPELQSKLIARAKLTTSWKSSDWRLTKAVGLTAKPTDQAFKPGLGLPNAGEALPRKSDQARWFECKIFTPIRQDLWLSFTSGPGFEVILDGKPIEAASRNLPLTLASGDHTLRIKLIGTPDRLPVEVKLENAWKSLAESKAWPKNDDADRLLIIADPNAPSVPKKLATRSQEIASRISTIETEFTTTLVAKDLPTPRETKILERGEYHLRIGDPLKPGVLAALGLSDSDAPMNRLGLARWLTDSNQPLVSRVLINRIWQRVFGYGLVRTPEEFGRQGDFPTHPALLDWLAVELQQSGWNLKHMLRLMLNSRTFKQISATRREIDDPENRLFARGPRQRLDAEVIRDIGLWASDLLDPHMGGEGVKPYQPAGMWKALTHPASNTVNYKADTGNRVYRRSLYVYWKRTSPHPMMTLFDAPSREASCVQRSQSNTPVQSLGLFNERQRLEMARALALKLLRIDGDQNRLDHLFNLLACREPNDAERRACKQLLETMRKRYQADPDATQEYVFANVDGKPGYPARLDEIAAWSQVTGMVLASDVAILLY